MGGLVGEWEDSSQAEELSPLSTSAQALGNNTLAGDCLSLFIPCVENT